MADSAAPALQARDVGRPSRGACSVSRTISPSQPSWCAMPAGDVLYHWRRPGEEPSAKTLQWQALQSVRATASPSNSVAPPAILGEVRVVLSQAAPVAQSQSLTRSMRDAGPADLQQGTAVGRRPRRARRPDRRGLRLARRPQARTAHRRADPQRRTHRPGRLHPPARCRAPRRARRAAAGARAHARQAAPDHHQQELPAQRPQQHDRCGVRHLAGRRHQGGELRGLQDARLRRRGDPRPQHHLGARRARAGGLRPAAGRARDARDRGAHAHRADHSRLAFRLADLERRPAVPGQHLLGAQHHRSQARRAAHPLSRPLRRAHQDSRTACSSSTCCSRRSRAACAAAIRWRCCISTWIASRK